jgi:hypothetical protein
MQKATALVAFVFSVLWLEISISSVAILVG